MTKDQALKELIELQHSWRKKQTHAEQDGNSNFVMLDGAISGLDIAIDIVKEIN